MLASDLARFEEPDALHWIAAKVYLAHGDTTQFYSYAALPLHRAIDEYRSGACAAASRR